MDELKPETWMFQHEETGSIYYVDEWQVKNSFEKNNPRLQKIAQMYSIKSGYALVPVEPTEIMIAAGDKALTDSKETDSDAILRATYKAMIKAAQEKK